MASFQLLVLKISLVNMLLDTLESLFISLSVCVTSCLFVCVCLCDHFTVCLHCPSVCLSVCLSFCLSVCLSVHLSDQCVPSLCKILNLPLNLVKSRPLNKYYGVYVGMPRSQEIEFNIKCIICHVIK